jgi:hypothetical protein
VFIKADITPNFDRPSHVAIYSGLFSINIATASPFLRLNFFENE